MEVYLSVGGCVSQWLSCSRPLEDKREKKSSLILLTIKASLKRKKKTYYVYAACCNVYLNRAREQTMRARYLCHYAADSTCPTDTNKYTRIPIYSYAATLFSVP